MIDTMISSSALILAIVLLRLILKDKISPNIRYGLWGLVVLRLVWPVFGTYICGYRPRVSLQRRGTDRDAGPKGCGD